MLDIALLRKNLPEVVARLKTRNFDFPEAEFNALEAERKSVQRRPKNSRPSATRSPSRSDLRRRPVKTPPP